MTEEQFWQIIEESRTGCLASDEARQCSNLRELLMKLNPDEILSFNQIFASKRLEAYRWDLWAIATIIHGGASDSSFDYFREWLISQGRDMFEAALSSPEVIAEKANPGDDLENMTLYMVGSRLYEELTGENYVSNITYAERQPWGKKWSEYDLLSMYPAACKKFRFVPLA